MSSNEDDAHRTVKPPSEPEMCKCGRGPVAIRKNGTSAGRCRQCMSDVAKKWPRGRKQSKKKKDDKSTEVGAVLDTHVLLGLLKERKEEAESLVNNLIEKGALNGDKDLSQAIISFIKFMATMDVVLKTETLENNNIKN
ncbi:MAG: hypothetical protein KQI62_05665 [Deltaproteobacteria bacterium]|nr:hypothetical protein [Deltaproteobacteria bacterium]